MKVFERSLSELSDYYQARRFVVDIVIDTISEETLDNSILSGFDACTALIGDVYEPSAQAIKEGILYATPINSHYLSWVGHYALNGDQPAIGVYDSRMFHRFNSVGYEVNPGITVADACTNIFVWR